VRPEARERYALACEMDGARTRRWLGEELDVTKRDGCYPLFSFSTALAAAPHDDHVLRRTVRRIGLLDRLQVFDEDESLHGSVERIFARLMADPPEPAGPPREALVTRISAAAASG
jgi:hypothetical protein